MEPQLPLEDITSSRPEPQPGWGPRLPLEVTIMSAYNPATTLHGAQMTRVTTRMEPWLSLKITTMSAYNLVTTLHSLQSTRVSPRMESRLPLETTTMSTPQQPDRLGTLFERIPWSIKPSLQYRLSKGNLGLDDPHPRAFLSFHAASVHDHYLLTVGRSL